jgi:hypothetical protein
MSKFLYQIQSGLNHQHTFGLIDYWIQTITGSGYTQTSQIQVEATGSITKIGVLFSTRTGTPGVFRISLEDPATPGVYLNSGTAYVDYNSGTGTVNTFAELTIPACSVVLGQYINVVTQTYSGTFDTNNRINHLYALSTGGYNFPNGGQFFPTPVFYYVINGKYYGYPHYAETSTTVSGTQEAGIKITIPRGAGTTHLLQDIVSKLNGNTPLSILIYAANGTTLLHQSNVIFGSNSWRANKFPLSSEFYMKSGETYYIVFRAPSAGTLAFAVVDGYNEQSWESQTQEYMIYVNRASNSVAFTETAGRRMSAQLRFKDLVSLDYYAPTSTYNKAINIKAGTISYSEYVQLNTTGLSFSTPGISASYVRSGAARVGITLVSQTVSGVWTSGGFVEVDAVNMPGLYRIDVPDGALASGANQVTLMIKGYNNTNGALVTYQFTQELMQVDMTQIYPNTNTAGTVGDALNAARSGAFGKRILIGRNINYYAPDEITITKSLELDSASAPLVRQENVEQNASITNSGLVFYLDAANSLSYPGTGTTWYDLTGNGNNGTLYNSPTYSNGEISFDGLDDYMQANILNTLLDGDPNFSVEFFVKRTSNFVNSGFWGIGGAGQGYGIGGWTPTQNEIHLDLYDSTRLSSGQYYPSNTYVHVVWAKSGTSISTSTVNLYINGVLTNLTLTRGQTTGPRYNTSTPGVGIALGRLNGNASSLYAPITVGTFRIYDRQLTQGEVLNNYNAQKSRFGL